MEVKGHQKRPFKGRVRPQTSKEPKIINIRASQVGGSRESFATVDYENNTKQVNIVQKFNMTPPEKNEYPDSRRENTSLYKKHNRQAARTSIIGKNQNFIQSNEFSIDLKTELN